MKGLKLSISAYFMAAAVLAGLTACATEQAEDREADKAAFFTQSTPPDVTTFSGSYLAGKFAQRQQDWNAAQGYLNNVLTHDDNNLRLRQRTFLLTLGAGNFSKARELAERILMDDAEDELALILLSCDALAEGDYNRAMTYLQRTPDHGAARYTNPLLTAWTMAGMGNVDEAIASLAGRAEPDDPTYRTHAGMMEEMRGNMSAAAEHYKIAMANGLTLHAAVLIGDFFTRFGQPQVSATIYDSLGKLYPFNPFIAAMQDGAHGKAGTRGIASAADGAAFAMFDLATMLYEKRAYDSAQIYGSLVQMLVPDSPFAHLMIGDIAAMHTRHAQALDKYNSISRESPLFWLSRMRVAEVYEAAGHLDLAVELLSDLTQYGPTRLNALVSIGDIQRRHENFAAAVEAYDTALTELGTLTEEHWPIIYARGISLERMNNWAQAEKDLLQALSWQPDNPMILNYIGYSWADKGVHMERALDFIRRAVALRPGDGYILDSYGWAFYRLGRYGEAVEWLEKAVSFVPDDATILDHLGDAYWQAGRYNEARFKWRRASEVSGDGGFISAVQQKIKTGISPLPSVQVVQKEAKL